MLNRRRLLLEAAAGTLVAAAVLKDARAAEPLRESFDMQGAPVAPIPVAVAGSRQLVYEVHLTNFSRDALSVRRLGVFDAGNGAQVAEYAGDALAERFAKIMRGESDAQDSTRVDPGRRAVIYIELAFSSGQVPSSLIHRVEYNAGETGISSVEGAPLAIGAAAPIVLGPPLRGGPWAGVHHPSWPRGHRRVLYTIDGRARIPGRFAIDWVRVNARDGRIARGDADRVRNHLGYGADAIAAADATVVAVRDGMEESALVSGNVRHPLADDSGNHVVLRVTPQIYAFYEHLKRGSIRVAAGDAVRRGEVIGALGFSGDSTGPHLHFHVADAPSPLGGEGLGFVFDRFELLGQYEDVGMLGRELWRARAEGLAAERREERPAANAVVRFAA